MRWEREREREGGREEELQEVVDASLVETKRDGVSREGARQQGAEEMAAQRARF